jgi:tRNA U34 5-methylaminomethyl-2-thiouridine-forming methyltransferase MnmC
MMKREVIITKDGSSSISIPEINVTYHSIHGALQESLHVFIHAGLHPLLHQYETIRIFEMGFGTGLNALLSLQFAQQYQQQIHYTAIELYPLNSDEALALHYEDENFLKLHLCEWEKDIALSDHFVLHKINASLLTYKADKQVNLIYYDAFAPSAQPELWTRDIFEKLFFMLDQNGILVTYSSKGDVRRALLQAGFTVEKIPGPAGKREMIRAIKATV